MGFANCRYNTKALADAIGVPQETLESAMKENALGGIARVWTVDNQGKYSTCQISTSKKDKESDKYETDMQDGFVRFVGRAHSVISNVGLPTAEENKNGAGSKGVGIRILNSEVTNRYKDPKSGKTYYGAKFTIFDIELLDAVDAKNTKKENDTAPTTSGQDDFMNIPDGIDEELPFD